jgi:hypothetical protein
VAWPIVKTEVVLAFDVFWHLDTRKFHTINEAIMVLLPKALNTIAIRDYRPTSLIHVLGKLFSKVLTNCLAPRLGELICLLKHVRQGLLYSR